MRAEDILDALELLPDEMILEADRKRNAPKAALILWKQILPLAACLVLVLSTAMVLGRNLLPGMAGSKSESSLEAPAAMAPQMADSAAPENFLEETFRDVSEAEAAAPAEAAQPEPPSDVDAAEIPHEEQAAGEEPDKAANGPADREQITIYLKETTVTLTGSDSAVMAQILENLDYDPRQICRCMAEFTVDTQLLTGIEVNLTEGFARCEKGQAPLTEEQIRTLGRILENLS